MSAMKEKIRNFILQNFLFTKDGTALNDADSLIGKGIVDSTGVLEVIQFIFDEYGIHVDDSEMIPENLDSIDNIVAFVERKQLVVSQG